MFQINSLNPFNTIHILHFNATPNCVKLHVKCWSINQEPTLHLRFFAAVILHNATIPSILKTMLQCHLLIGCDFRRDLLLNVTLFQSNVAKWFREMYFNICKKLIYGNKTFNRIHGFNWGFCAWCMMTGFKVIIYWLLMIFVAIFWFLLLKFFHIRLKKRFLKLTYAQPQVPSAHYHPHHVVWCPRCSRANYKYKEKTE